MKVLLINSVCGIRSTGRIATDIAEEYIANGHECKIAYGRETVPERYQDISYRIGTDYDIKLNALKARVFDNEGFNATKVTKSFLKWANDYNPDLVWLHNLHGYYINIELLFDWLRQRPQMQVRWTLHDCWAFTGHCSHFSYVQCYRWQECCHHCVQKKEYPKSLFIDHSVKNFRRKEKVFLGVSNMTLITPSQWLADLVGQSFLREYHVEVRHNTIDRSVFKPTPSDFRKHMGLENKKIVLGVASTWSNRKGLSDFVALAEQLGDGYVVLLVGVQEAQRRYLPKKILCLPRTNSIRELAEIYTAADVFVNSSREETFGLTTIEAMACGTPAIVYENTACEEVVNTYGGMAIEQSIPALLVAVKSICERNDSI